jgi:hypothetical protein
MKNLKRLSIAILVLLCLAVNTNMKAQYVIASNLPCNATVDITIYDNSIPSCAGICATFIGMSLPAGGVVPIPTGACPGFCNIEVTVTDISGIPQIGYTADFITSVAISGPCGVGGLKYDTTATTFKLYQ